MFSIETILNYIKKTFSKRDFVVIFGIIILYALTRLVNLDKWPIFSDEGIYIRWAKVAWKDASWRFISITDGRQPLQTWGTIPFLKFFPEQALFAGRLFSVATGFVALSGIFSILLYLWGKRAALIGALIYVCMPYFVFYDRMALVDSAVNAGFVWVLFFSILLVRMRRLDTALILGFIGGFSLLAKSSSRMFLMLSAAAPVLYLGEKRKKFFLQSMNYFVLLGIAVLISFIFYNVQRLSPFFQYVAQKNNTFVMTFDEFLKTPFAYVHNFKYIPLYIAWESGWFIIPFSLLGLFLLYKKNRLLAMYLSIFIILPYIAISFFAKILFPRYVLFYGSLIVITSTFFFINIKNKTKTLVILSLLITSMLIFDHPLLFNPIMANFPPVDRGQYVNGLTSVWGAGELVDYLRSQSHKKDVLVLAEGDFGLVADVLKVYINEGEKIDVQGKWPLEEKDLLENQAELQKRDVYVVFSHRQEFPENWPIELIEAYPKPGTDLKLFLFKLTPEKSYM